uniref:RNA dependent RNA polymerase n=1 Tax=Fusarium boothii mitovirus 1 TaxID=2364128 RepID=A0A3G9H9G4_9VIRU|nr:RNA dependent RNA polymerase [Fusarium boothii mitovirus 1]
MNQDGDRIPSLPILRTLVLCCLITLIMKSTSLTLLNSIKLLKSRSVRKMKMFPLSSLTTSLLPTLAEVNTLALGRVKRVKDRIRVSHNFLVYLTRMYHNHGSEFTIKWLKSSHVALQKYLGGDKLKSLRDLEPNCPLPRLINGCPAYINKRDRSLMREGNSFVSRYWLTQFGIYRVLLGPFKPKLSTITDSYKGSVRASLELIPLAFNPFINFYDKIDFRAPTTLFLSHKGSPSNSLSYKGILTDFCLLKYSSVRLSKIDFSRPKHSPIYDNLLKYLDLLEVEGRLPLRRFRSVLSSLDTLASSLKSEGLSLNTKVSMRNGLSQFAVKEEAAGKLRVFALLDSISQSALKPLHEFLFDILRRLPNDGTFDQDASVKRSNEKFSQFGIAYSFDLSAATDRLPVDLTGSILEQLVGIKGFSSSWKSIMVDRDFQFPEAVVDKYFKGEDPGYIRYSVGQPMGGLSSWAGLAITHHWILQLCSSRLNNLGWETRYEILGDDIVIFDSKLAKMYLYVMQELGLEVNSSKSINASHSGFEFAKRTMINGVDVSALSLQQMLSSTSLGSKVIDTFVYCRKGLVSSISHFSRLLTGIPDNSVFRRISKTGLPALSFLNVLWSADLVQLRIVLEAVVNPKYEDFDFDRSKFDLPLVSLLGYMLDIANGSVDKTYPFSMESDRRDFSRDYEPHLAAVILQESLSKIKTLSRDYDHLIKTGALALFKGKASALLNSQFEGFFSDIIIDLTKLDPYDKVDEIESILYRHAKTPSCSVGQALTILEEVNSLVFKFTFKTEISRVKYEKDSSPILQLLRKSEGRIPINYWQTPVLSY